MVCTNTFAIWNCLVLSLLTGTPVELAKEIAFIINGNREALKSHTQKVFKNNKEKVGYLNRRQFIEDRLKVKSKHCSLK